jgi:phosphohistidine phosphatase SixA
MTKRTLVLMRHPQYDTESMHATEFGRVASRRTAEKLFQEEIHPDLILTTPEIRGQEGAQEAADVYNSYHVPLQGPCVVRELDEKGKAQAIIGVLQKMPDGLKTIFGVSHRGTIGDSMLALLAPADKMRAMEHNEFALDTSDAVVIEFEDAEHWADVQPDSASSYHLVHNAA